MSRFALLLGFLILPITLSAQTLDSIYTLSDTISDQNDRIEWLLKVAYGYYGIDPDITEHFGLYALETSKSMDFEVGIAKANHILGIAYWTTGAYDRALSHNFEALNGYEKLGDQRRAKLIRMNNCNIYGELGQHKKAIKVLLKIISEAEEQKDSTMLGWAYNNISTEYRRLHLLDSALHFLSTGLPYRLAANDTLGIIGMNNNKGLIMIEAERPIDALEALNKARSLLTHKPNPKRLAEVYTNMASAHEMLGQFEQMKLYSDSCLTIAKEIKDLRLQNTSYSSFSRYYSQKQIFDQSLKFFQMSTAIKDTIFSQEVRKETEVLELKYEDEKKAKQLLVLEQQQARDKFEFWLLVIVSSAVVLIAVLMIYTLRLRVRNVRMREKELETQLEQKNKELTSYALNFIQKNELLNELTDKISELKKQSDTKSIKELNQMNGIINNSFRMDQDWENFKLMFEELHGDFFGKLKHRFPELGNAELRLCALLRLNMNLKESSKILGISSDSVKTARYRLRKKLGLATEDNLVDFLIKFDDENQHLAIA